ncbi:hypothetical protein K469DRAFT_690287 [Zopfia rhizophila CBS 207.26]|uniref:Fungal N-terminal domain-containing protein n=1 Tax=Zopfia rhizophila CBS 207.26 TaxID=1314779 RepID=A0A6A6DYY1_9PEZI|nr:hypothetical protein K469DRAFT_690287 [Zopfia rhizophila CBS 207.26]
MADPVGGILNIATVLKKAYDLYNARPNAPEEIRFACNHVHCMNIVLEGVKSDLLTNPRSFLHQHIDITETRTHGLKLHLNHCDRSLRRLEGLLKKYHSFRHVGSCDRFRCSVQGKKEIADTKVDLIMAMSQLDLFKPKEGLLVLWRLESMMEMMKKFEALRYFRVLLVLHKPRAGGVDRMGAKTVQTEEVERGEKDKGAEVTVWEDQTDYYEDQFGLCAE